MMTEDQRLIILIASRLLTYPDEQLLAEQTDIRQCIREDISSTLTKVMMHQAVKPLYQLRLRELQEVYVESFDYKDLTALYLTAHECGDSRKRGLALVELQQLLSNSGYERLNEELPDYIPLLFELLTLMPKYAESEQLHRRLACAVYQIMNRLPEHHPYLKLFEVLIAVVFDSPSAEEIEQFQKEREEADVDPLPYPMLYQ